MSRFARGRAALAGGGFREEAAEQFESSDLKFENSENQLNRSVCCNDERRKGSESANVKVEISGNHSNRGFRPSREWGEKSDIPNLKCEISENRANDGHCRGDERAENSENSHLKCEIPEAKQSSARESGLRVFQSDSALRPLKDGVEEAQAQDLNSDWKMSGKKKVCAPGNRAACGEVAEQATQNSQNPLLDLDSNAQFDSVACGQASEQRTQHSQNLLLDSNSKAETDRGEQHAGATPAVANRAARTASAGATPGTPFQWRDQSHLVARELAVGRGPVCGPVKVNPKALERIRARDAARRAGSRSP
jgi:hypothetical protein